MLRLVAASAVCLAAIVGLVLPAKRLI